MKFAIVQGTRPEIIKNFPIVEAFRSNRTPYTVLHTNQHHDHRMRDQIYANMDYGPNHILSRSYSLGNAIDWVQSAIREQNIGALIVNGDTAASLIGALAAMYSNKAIIHIEAGLRCGDPLMLEERNRIMVDAISHHLFAYTDYEQRLLTNSQDIRGQVYVEGNTTVDVIEHFAHKLKNPLREEPYAFATLHRRELTTNRKALFLAVQALNRIAQDLVPIVFPAHPRTYQALNEQNLLKEIDPRVLILPPCNFFESLNLQKWASVVITDSGCIQEEAYILGTPTVTMRNSTERHLTVQHGANTVAGLNPDSVFEAVRTSIEGPTTKWPQIYGEPGVGYRIVRRLEETTSTAMPKRASRAVETATPPESAPRIA